MLNKSLPSPEGVLFPVNKAGENSDLLSIYPGVNICQYRLNTVKNSSNFPKDKQEKTSIYWLTINGEGNSQWHGCEINLEVFLGEARLFHTNLLIGRQFSYKFHIIAASAQSIHLNFVTRFNGDFIPEGSFDQYQDELFKLKLLISEDSVYLETKRPLIESAVKYSAEIGLNKDYFSQGFAQIIIEKIRDSIIKKMPLSIIRLGDGEGRVLGYPNLVSDQEALSQVLNYHFGPLSMRKLANLFPGNSISYAMHDLQRLIHDALKSADYVGLPITNFFGTRDKKLTSGHVGYASALILGRAAASHLSSDRFVGTNFFQLLAKNKENLIAIMGASNSFWLVGPHDVRCDIQRVFGFSEVDFIEVPGHYTWRETKGYGQYPDLFRFVLRKLMSLGDLRGQLFLVGAGLLGKYYCHAIKSQGGVALDFGSVFDSWAGKGRPDAVRNASLRLRQG